MQKNYQTSFLSGLPSSFSDSFHGGSGKNNQYNQSGDSTALPLKIISKNYFPPIGKFDEEFKQYVRDFCVRKEARDMPQNNYRNEAINQLFEREMSERSMLRAELRSFAKKKLHAHYRTSFHDVWGKIFEFVPQDLQRNPAYKLNSVDEIEGFVNTMLRYGLIEGNSSLVKVILDVVGFTIYRSFSLLPNWETIMEDQFMSEKGLAYENEKGKGCIARCITAEKAEQNKRFQDITKKYKVPLTKRLPKETESERRKPRSGDFYVVTSGTAKRKQNVDENGAKPTYVLMHDHDVIDANSINITSEKRRRLVTETEGQEPVNTFERKPLCKFSDLLGFLVTQKITYLRQHQVSEYHRKLFFRKILKGLLETPSDTLLPEKYQKILEELFDDSTLNDPSVVDEGKRGGCSSVDVADVDDDSSAVEEERDPFTMYSFHDESLSCLFVHSHFNH